MKTVIATVCLFLLAPFVSAYEVQELIPETPYEPLASDYHYDEQLVLLGNLDGFPLMYEMEADKVTNFSASLRQSPRDSVDPIPFSLIIVRQNDDGGGVTEIGRMNSSDESWKLYKDNNFNLSLLEGGVFSAEVEPGTYRIEVSTPENMGRYMLLIGTQELSVGYFDKLKETRLVHKHFGYSIFRMLLVPGVFYPIGTILILFAIQRTWKYRKMIAHVG